MTVTEKRPRKRITEKASTIPNRKKTKNSDMVKDQRGKLQSWRNSAGSANLSSELGIGVKD